MKYLLCFLFLIFTHLFSDAQYNVVFKLGKYPLQHPNDSIFIAGNFNEWNPRNTAFSLSPALESSFQTTVQLTTGNYEYKSTRGNWKKVESLENGKDIENHSFEINSDTTIVINVKG